MSNQQPRSLSATTLTTLMTMLALTAPAFGEPAAAPATSSAPRPEPSESQLSQKFGIDDRDPEAAVPSVKERNDNPLELGYLMQDLIARAEASRKAHDNAAAVRYYRAIAKAAPERATAWGKLCEAYQAVNDRERAVTACRYALARPGVELQDYLRFVSLSVAKDDALTPAEAGELTAVVKHLAEDPALALAASHVACQVGVKLADVAMLETCTAALDKLAPDDSKTVIFKWALAVQKGRRDEAARLFERAKEMGVLSDNLERMQTLTFAPSRRPPRWAIVGGALLIAALSYALWTVRRRRAFAHH